MNIDKMIDKDFSGCVSIVEDGKTVYQKAFGYADRANEIPNQCSTRFATASAGKVFVAVGILQLIEQKILRLDDTLGSLLISRSEEDSAEASLSTPLTNPARRIKM